MPAECLEYQYYSCAAYGPASINATLLGGGPLATGCQKANLTNTMGTLEYVQVWLHAHSVSTHKLGDRSSGFVRRNWLATRCSTWLTSVLHWALLPWCVQLLLDSMQHGRRSDMLSACRLARPSTSALPLPQQPTQRPA